MANMLTRKNLADAALLRLLEGIEATRLADDAELSREEQAAGHLRVRSRRCGIVDVLRGGLAPLDYDTISKHALEVDLGAQQPRIASLPR